MDLGLNADAKTPMCIITSNTTIEEQLVSNPADEVEMSRTTLWPGHANDRLGFAEALDEPLSNTISGLLAMVACIPVLDSRKVHIPDGHNGSKKVKWLLLGLLYLSVACWSTSSRISISSYRYVF